MYKRFTRTLTGVGRRGSRDTRLLWSGRGLVTVPDAVPCGRGGPLKSDRPSVVESALATLQGFVRSAPELRWGNRHVMWLRSEVRSGARRQRRRVGGNWCLKLSPLMGECTSGEPLHPEARNSFISVLLKDVQEAIALVLSEHELLPANAQLQLFV